VLIFEVQPARNTHEIPAADGALFALRFTLFVFSRLASMLKIPYTQAIMKTRETPSQKRVANSAYQAATLIATFYDFRRAPQSPAFIGR
jgi:hypothetical protein